VTKKRATLPPSVNTSNAYRLTFTYRFEAAHRFTRSCADSCATPHGHTWYAKAIFEAPETALGSDDMVMEFSILKKSWKSFIQEYVDHSFMHHYQDPIMDILRKEIPKLRALPFPGDPTTELIAALFFAKLKTMHEAIPGAEAIKPAGVVIRETPTNSVTFRSRDTSKIATLNEKFEGWWQSPDPAARFLR
jgi:6-pyruvoyl-tetrahydropterin synthase